MAKPVHSRYIQITGDIRVRVSHKVFKEVEGLLMLGAGDPIWFPKRDRKYDVRSKIEGLAKDMPEHFSPKSLSQLGLR